MGNSQSSDVAESPQRTKSHHLVALPGSSNQVLDDPEDGDESFYSINSSVSDGVLMNHLASGKMAAPSKVNGFAATAGVVDCSSNNRLGKKAQSKNVHWYYCHPCAISVQRNDMNTHVESQEHKKYQKAWTCSSNEETEKGLLFIDDLKTPHSRTQYLSDESGIALKAVESSELTPQNSQKDPPCASSADRHYCIICAVQVPLGRITEHENCGNYGKMKLLSMEKLTDEDENIRATSTTFGGSFVDGLGRAEESNEESLHEDSSSLSEDSLNSMNSDRTKEVSAASNFTSGWYCANESRMLKDGAGIKSQRACLVESGNENLVVRTVISNRKQFEKVLTNAYERYIDLEDESIIKIDGGKIRCGTCGIICPADSMFHHLLKKKHFLNPSWIQDESLETLKLNFEFLNFFLAVRNQYVMWSESWLKLATCKAALTRLKMIETTGFSSSSSKCHLLYGSGGSNCNEMSIDDPEIVCTENNGILNIQSPSKERITKSIKKLSEKYVLLDKFVKLEEDGTFSCSLCDSRHGQSKILNHVCHSKPHCTHPEQTAEEIEEKKFLLSSLLRLRKHCSKMKNVLRVSKKCKLTTKLCFSANFCNRITKLRNMAREVMQIRSLCKTDIEADRESDFSSVHQKSVNAGPKMDKEQEDGKCVSSNDKYAGNQQDAIDTIVIGECSSISLQEEFNLACVGRDVGDFEMECGICGGIFQLFNDDVQFSLDMHIQNDSQHVLATAVPVDRNVQQIAEMFTTMTVSEQSKATSKGKTFVACNYRQQQRKLDAINEVLKLEGQHIVSDGVNLTCKLCRVVVKNESQMFHHLLVPRHLSVRWANRFSYDELQQRARELIIIFEKYGWAKFVIESAANWILMLSDRIKGGNELKESQLIKTTIYLNSKTSIGKKPTETDGSTNNMAVRIAKTFFCEVCNKTMNCEAKKAHLAGKKHKKMLGIKPVAQPTRTSKASIVIFYCEVCNLSMNSSNKKRHLAENGHINMMLQANQVKSDHNKTCNSSQLKYFCNVCNRKMYLCNKSTHEAGYAHKAMVKCTVPPPLLPEEPVISCKDANFYCELCKRVMSLASRESHLSGKSHIAKLALPSPSLHVQPKVSKDANFYCIVCETEISLGSRDSHLSGKSHIDNLAASRLPAFAFPHEF